MQRLRPAEHRCERLDRGPDQVDLRLLRRERHAGGLRVEAHKPAARILRAVLVAHLRRPDPARGAVLRDLLEEVEMRVEEEGQSRRERVDVEAALEARLDEREPVGQGERKLLRGVRAGLADVVSGDRDRVHERHVLGAPLDHVDDEPHRRVRREDPLLLRDVLLEDVRLDGSTERCERHSLLLADARVEREQHRGRAVDRHRRRDLAERDAGEERLHVGERVDRDALAADLAERARMVGVVAHQRRHVERGRQAGLAVLEQVAEPLVRLLRRAEPGELAHRPEPAAVHRRVDAARERELCPASRGRARSRHRRRPASRAARSRRPRSWRRARPAAPASRRSARATPPRRRCAPLCRSPPSSAKSRADVSSDRSRVNRSVQREIASPHIEQLLEMPEEASSKPYVTDTT